MPNEGEGSFKTKDLEEISEYQRLRKRLFSNSPVKKEEPLHSRPENDSFKDVDLKWSETPRTPTVLYKQLKTPFAEVQDFYRVPQSILKISQTRNPNLKSPGPSPAIHEEVCDQKEPTEMHIIDNSLQPKQFSWPKFFVDFSGFHHILHKSYYDMEMTGSCIHQEISFGMWQYYHTIMLWKKILRILGNRGEKYLEHLQIEALIPDMPLHFAIVEYLNGIGSLERDHQGKFAKFIVQGYPMDHSECGAMGSFGRISAQNHWIYETLPAPVVSLLKIRADLIYTTASGDQLTDWDLPSGLRPTEESATLPTESLLGWTRAVKLTDIQIKLLKEAGFSRTDFGVTNVGTIPVNGDLMRIIGYLLEKSELSQFEKMHPGVAGSMAQIPYWEKIDFQERGEDANQNQLINISSNHGIMKMPAFFCEHIQTKARMFRYRMKRIPLGKIENQNMEMLCYRFNQPGPPDSWLTSANACWDFEAEKLNWNTGTWTMPITDEIFQTYLCNLTKK